MLREEQTDGTTPYDATSYDATSSGTMSFDVQTAVRPNRSRDRQALGPGDVLPGGNAFAPPLLVSLAGLLRLHGRPQSLLRLSAGLPGGFSPPGVEDCLRAAEAAGAGPRLLAIPQIADIPEPALPCILLLGVLSDGRRQTCILLERLPAEDRARVIFPESEPDESWIPLSRLEKAYSGHAVFVPRSVPRDDPRVSSPHPGGRGHWFWSVIGQFAPLYRDAAIASFVVNLLSLATPLFVMNVYDRVVPNNAVYTLWVLVAGVLIAYCMDFALRTIRSHYVDTAGRNADVLLSSRLVERILHMRLDARPESTGALVNNLREIEQVRDFFGSTTLLTLFDLPFLAIFLLLVSYIGGPMVLLILAALPLMLGFIWLVQLPFQRAAACLFKQNMQKNSLLVEIAAGLETVKSILAQGHMQHLWESVADSSASESARARRLSALAHTGSAFITQVLNAAVIIAGVYLITEGRMTQGGLIACVILVGRALGPLQQIAGMITQMQRSRIALKAVEQIMGLPTEQEGNPGSDSKGLEPELALHRVAFRYPRSPKSALHDCTLRIRPGEKVGVVGATGSGKSTLARLLVGLYQPEDGSVAFGGVDIRQIDQADLRSRIGFMPQDNYLFYGTVRENIALGCPWMDMKSVARAAELAGVAEFVSRHPQGYDMQVGERGMALSGGQRQAVALARTLIRAPDVLILDEPSSNLDMEGEHRLMLRLKAIIGNKTLLIMTHRPSLLSLVDRVVVLREGTVIADGPRDALLRARQRGPAPASASTPASASARATANPASTAHPEGGRHG